MDRKSFLKKSALAAFSMSMIGKVVEASPKKFIASCETTNDILGPFYREGAPERSDMLFEGLEGNEINLKGKVLSNDCTTPLENAIVEVWHCDTEGNYDNDSPKYLHRAKAITGKDGSYAFKTIIPGKYLNGRLYRPSHIHFRVRAKDHKELVSQIYFAGDPHITEDPWASQKKAVHRILPVFPDDTQANLSVEFDIYLSNS
jgi:catechol 1,2-dioxygenase